MLEQINAQSYFVYEKDIEYILAAIELLKPQNANERIYKVYSKEFIERKKQEYPLLFEVYKNLDARISLGILEHIINCDIANFSLDAYFSYLRKLKQAEFIATFLNMDKAEIEQALESENKMIAFYQKNAEYFTSYFTVEALLQKTEWFINEMYAFINELKTSESEKYLNKCEKEISAWNKKIVEALKEKEPLEYSQEIMGKQFRNRGPYKKFYFMPAYFMPYKVCRWYGENQMLIFDAVRILENDKTQIPTQLKMLSDNTRYQILCLLRQQGPLSGIEIAEQMKLAASTVSHHMTQLKNSGLVHEEPSYNTKYYSVNQKSIETCIKHLQDTFL